MKFFNYIFIILAILFIPKGMSAFPRYALRMGAQCADCHVNPTGGEMRNAGGWHYGMRSLPLVSPREMDDSLNMSNEIGKNIDFGFDYRTQYLYSQELSKTTFQKMQGAVYVDAKVMDSIDIYANYDFVNAFWEGYIVAHILPNYSYIKVGSFVPDFGVMLDDHTAYTRGGDLGFLFPGAHPQGLIFTPGYNVTGVEAGYNISNFGLWTASVGSPISLNFNSDPTYTTSIKFNPVIGNTLALTFGGSYMVFTGPLGGYDLVSAGQKVNMYGGFFGFGIWNFTLIGEYDIAHDYIQSSTKSSAQMVEASYLIIKGLEAVLRYDHFTPNTSDNSEKLSRIIAGFSFYPYSFVELIPQYRFQFDTPAANNNSALLQFHFYY
jgi:hypothetical protein